MLISIPGDIYSQKCHIPLHQGFFSEVSLCFRNPQLPPGLIHPWQHRAGFAGACFTHCCGVSNVGVSRETQKCKAALVKSRFEGGFLCAHIWSGTALPKAGMRCSFRSLPTQSILGFSDLVWFKPWFLASELPPCFSADGFWASEQTALGRQILLFSLSQNQDFILHIWFLSLFSCFSFFESNNLLQFIAQVFFSKLLIPLCCPNHFHHSLSLLSGARLSLRGLQGNSALYFSTGKAEQFCLIQPVSHPFPVSQWTLDFWSSMEVNSSWKALGEATKSHLWDEQRGNWGNKGAESFKAVKSLLRRFDYFHVVVEPEPSRHVRVSKESPLFLLLTLFSYSCFSSWLFWMLYNTLGIF